MLVLMVARASSSSSSSVVVVFHDDVYTQLTAISVAQHTSVKHSELLLARNNMTLSSAGTGRPGVSIL